MLVFAHVLVASLEVDKRVLVGIMSSTRFDKTASWHPGFGMGVCVFPLRTG